jgi:hypothetical protein
MKKSYLPKYQINPVLVDLLAETELLLVGITDAKSYFSVWSVRIIVWVIVCALVGALIGGLGGMLWGVLAGMVMPLFVMYLAIILPIFLAELAGYLVGVAWVLFCLWLVFSLLFRW